ncbi:MAG: four helix bundle protein [Candidatus Edwardsbacteria bacterium]|nr:four helix bundle protein [Candidatus Edwardsbacteria bacterium]
MSLQKNEISERLLNFAANVIKLMSPLAKSAAGFHVSKQLMRSATSAGANYEECCGAESKNDFIHKMQIVLKELKESLYWLRLIRKAQLVPDAQTEGLLNEANELVKIIAKSVITAKRGK